MRFSKWLIAASLLVLPVATIAIDDTEITTEAGSGSETTVTAPNPNDITVIQFDPKNNIIGDPADKQKLSTGTIAEVTFLSGGNDPASILVNVINVSLSFLGILSMIMILYAGVVWFFARDNEESVTKSKDILAGAVIGLVITLSAMGLAQLLFNLLVDVTSVEARSAPVSSEGLASVYFPLLATAAEAADTEPTYEPEELPFNPLVGSYSDNIAIQDGGVAALQNPASLGLGYGDPVSVTIAIINIALTLLGMGFLVLLIYAGVTWVLARGNEEQITKAKTILKRAVVGLIIILSAYGVSALVFRILQEYTIFDNPQL